MESKNFKVGEKLKHQNKQILEIVEIDGVKYFQNEDGDTFSYIDDGLILYML